VSALSTGLDRAQAEVLEPLTGGGTDMSVTRPIDIGEPGQGGFPNLSDDERQRLREENEGGRLGLTDLGEPGTRFSRDTFTSGTQLSFSASEAADIRALDGVSAAAGGLTLNAIHVEGVVPERTEGPSGQASDVYVQLAQLQALADRKGRINTVYVRAESSDDVAAVADRIEQIVDGASVTTAEDLAARVSGTLVDAKNLAGKLGTALMIVGLAAAFLIASLLTLSSVTKRVRELGTLKAVGWPQRMVVRQVTAESLAQGLLGGALGVVLGVGGALLIGELAPTLEATVTTAADAGPRFIGPFGQGAVEPAATEVALGAPVSVGLVLAAVGLALLGGLVAGASGGLRAARLRPADALRHID
jgi:ABC-type lipoprotein release transport system permease subunit